jgi:hypothetical protein
MRENLQGFELQMFCDYQSETVKVLAAVIPNACNYKVVQI